MKADELKALAVQVESFATLHPKSKALPKLTAALKVWAGQVTATRAGSVVNISVPSTHFESAFGKEAHVSDINKGLCQGARLSKVRGRDEYTVTVNMDKVADEVAESGVLLTEALQPEVRCLCVLEESHGFQDVAAIALELAICATIPASKKAVAVPRLAVAFELAATKGHRAEVTTDGSAATVYLPVADFDEAFKEMSVGHVNDGLLGLGRASKIVGQDVVAVVANLDKIRSVGGVVGSFNRKAYPAALFGEANEEQVQFRTKWRPPLGINTHDCPKECGKAVHTVVTGVAKTAFDDLVNQVGAMPDQDAVFSNASTNFVFRRAAQNVAGFDMAAQLFCFVVRRLRRALRGCDRKEPLIFVERLEARHVDDDLWLRIKKANKETASLEVQLLELSKPEAVQDFIKDEKDDLERAFAGKVMPVADANRLRNLINMANLLNKPGIREMLAEIAHVECENNSSRKARVVVLGLPTGPPRDPLRKKVRFVPLRNWHRGDLKKVTVALHMTTQVFGHLRTTTVLDKSAFDPTDVEKAHGIDVEELSREATHMVTGSRCWLARLHQRKVYSSRLKDPDGTKHVLKQSHTLFGADKPTKDKPRHGVYMATIMLRVSYKVPVVLRPEAFKTDGSGGFVFIDEGMRARTAIQVNCTGRTDTELSVTMTAVEELTQLTAIIRPALIASAKDRSKAARSRARRLQDPNVQAHLNKLKAKVNSLKEEGKDVPFRLEKEMGIALAHGAFKGSLFKSELNELVEEGDEAEATKRAKVEEGGNDRVDDVEAAARELDELLKADLEVAKADLDKECGDDAGPPKVAEAYKDKYLGPLFDPKQYEAHCNRRRHKGLKPISPRRFTKIQERRTRRKAKRRLWHVQGNVIRMQDAALRRLIPEGTSAAFLGRLNFHEFKLYKRIMAVFQVLSLCSYWDRTFIYCVNRGIVLVEICEGYTTKQCPGPNCGMLNNVGAKKVFKCARCQYTCPRDIKVGE